MTEKVSVDKQRIQIKLDAILTKDLDDIINKHTYIPMLGFDYTREQLQKWLDDRAAVLTEILTFDTIEQVNTKLTSYGIASKETDLTKLSSVDFDKLCFINLCKFSLGET